MAKKIKSKKRKGARRVGAFNPSSGTAKLIAVAVGYLLADTINGAIDKALPASVLTPTNPQSMVKYIPAAAQVGIGGYLLMSKGKSSIIKTLAGGVLAGSGVKRVLKATGVIAGYQAVPVIGKANHKMAGYQSVPVVGGIPAQLAGSPAQLAGYRVNGAGYTPAGSGSGVMGAVNPRISSSSSGSGITNPDGGSYMG
jgi:hypothetical protein